MFHNCFIFLIKEPDNITIFSWDGWFIGSYIVNEGYYSAVAR